MPTKNDVFFKAGSWEKDIIFGGHLIQIFSPSSSIRALTGIAMVFGDRKVAKEDSSQRTKKPREIFKNHNKFVADLLLEQTQNLLVVWLLKVEEITMGYGSALHNKLSLDFVTSCNTKVCLTEVILTFLDTLFVRSQKASNFFFYWERTWLMHSGAGCIETKYQNKNACVLAFLTEPYLTQLHCTKVCFDTQSGPMTMAL